MASAERGEPGTWRYLAWWDANDSIDLERTLATLPASDRDAAELIAGCWPDELFYDPGNGKAGTWYLWDGQCQRPDHSKQIDRLVSSWTRMADHLLDACRQQLAAITAVNMPGQPRQAIDAAVKTAWDAWQASAQWKYVRSLRGHGQAAKLREQLAGLAGTDTGTWPDHPLLLNMGNCVVSLDPAATGWEWCPHDPALRMTYCLPAPWEPADPEDPLAGCPGFARLLWHACGEDKEVFWYLVHVLGYSLLGDNRHQVLFFLSGPTASGKSTLLEIVSTVLGELAHEAKPELITKAASQRHGRHEASIIGKRLVTIGETNSQLRLDENQLKILTGQKKMSIDVLWRTELTGALISALIMVANNDMPEVAHLDAGLTRRLWVIPMGETIPEHERDSAMAGKIVREEGAGVLAALIWACREVMASGGRLLTMPPAAVMAKTESYKREQNTTGLWFAERCVPANGQAAAQKGSACIADYREWCGQEERIALGTQNFYGELARLAGVVRAGASDQAWFHGFVLRHPPRDG